MQEGSNMVQVLDSRKINNGQPITFQQGNFHVVKCWELSVILLHSNEKIKVSCPAYLSNGGAVQYSHFGSQKIPANTPLIYELEILECSHRFEDLLAVGKKFYFLKTEGNIVHSDLPKFNGDNTHDASGKLKRKGGGPAIDIFEETEKLLDQATNKIKVVENQIEQNKKSAEKIEN